MPHPQRPILGIVTLDQDGVPMNCAAKTCSGAGLSTLQRWLGEGEVDVLRLHNGRSKLLVLVSWDAWSRVARTIIKPE
jgi:hypothetical protein